MMKGFSAFVTGGLVVASFALAIWCGLGILNGWPFPPMPLWFVSMMFYYGFGRKMLYLMTHYDEIVAKVKEQSDGEA